MHHTNKLSVNGAYYFVLFSYSNELFFQAIPFPAEHFTPPNKGSLSSYVTSLLPTTTSGHENTLPCSGSMRPLPPESLPKRWRGNNFSWKDRPLDLSEESGSESERDQRNGSSNNQILESHRSSYSHAGHEETSTSDSSGSLYYLTDRKSVVEGKSVG